jgi:hypothetical protein
MNAIDDRRYAELLRLEELEKTVREGYEQYIKTGLALKEIRDCKLWRAAGCRNWTDYLKTRAYEAFGIERKEVFRMIQAAVIRLKLPEIENIVPNCDNIENQQWKPAVIREFARLASVKEDEPGKPRDVDSLTKPYLKKVATRVFEEAQQTGKPLSQAIVRNVVDKELGIDRVAEAEKTREATKELEEEYQRLRTPQLDDYLLNKKYEIRKIKRRLMELDDQDDVWKFLEKDSPFLTNDLLKELDELSEYIRSKK